MSKVEKSLSHAFDVPRVVLYYSDACLMMHC